MNRLILAATLILGASASANAGAKTPEQAVKALVSFKAPKAWRVVSYANAGDADPVLRFESGSDAILIRAFGAPGSDYPAPADFVDGSAYGSGSTVVAGRKLDVRRKRFPIEAADPHRPSPGQAILGTEEFCVLPLSGGRFAVLAYRRASPLPDPERKGAKAWAAFLKSVKPKK